MPPSIVMLIGLLPAFSKMNSMLVTLAGLIVPPANATKSVNLNSALPDPVSWAVVMKFLTPPGCQKPSPQAIDTITFAVPVVTL